MYLDIFIAILLLWGMFRGFKRGLIIELCTLMALVLGIYGAAAFGDTARNYLESAYNTDPRISLVLGFSIIFIIIVVVVFIFGKILEKVIKMVALGMVNKILGLIFGATKFLLIISGLFFILNGLPLTQNIIPENWKKDSLLYPFVESVVSKISPVLNHFDLKYKLPTTLDNIDERQVENE